MNVNDELTGDLEPLQSTVTDIIKAYKDMQQLAADLKAQIASGADRTLSVEQAAAFKSRVDTITQSMRTALASAVPNPTPDVVPVLPGETNIPPGGS